MKIQDYINKYFNGNKSAFARSVNKTYDQIQRWVNQDCYIFDGRVHSSPKTEQSKTEVAA